MDGIESCVTFKFFGRKRKEYFNQHPTKIPGVHYRYVAKERKLLSSVMNSQKTEGGKYLLPENVIRSKIEFTCFKIENIL